MRPKAKQCVGRNNNQILKLLTFSLAYLEETYHKEWNKAKMKKVVRKAGIGIGVEAFL
jgi:hypothetical protein